VQKRLGAHLGKAAQAQLAPVAGLEPAVDRLDQLAPSMDKLAGGGGL
jgi:hypothetical protein